METDTIMHNARELKLLADRYSFFQDALTRGPEDVQWMANEVSNLRVAMMRMSQCLQGVALDRTRAALKQLELDYTVVNNP